MKVFKPLRVLVVCSTLCVSGLYAGGTKTQTPAAVQTVQPFYMSLWDAMLKQFGFVANGLGPPDTGG